MRTQRGSLGHVHSASQSAPRRSGRTWLICRGGSGRLSRSGAGRARRSRGWRISSVQGTHRLSHIESLRLAAYVLSSRSTSPSLAFDTAYGQLKDSLLSHSRSLRLNVLRLLSSPLVQTSEGTAELLKKSLQAEEISIDVQGVRERVLRIGRLPIAVKDGDDIAAEVCTRWLIGAFPNLFRCANARSY